MARRCCPWPASKAKSSETYPTSVAINRSGNNIAVKLTYDNGTVYEGFVNVATGLADGEGSVTWGPKAGRSSRKTYTGQFTAGRTAERVKFKWTEKRPGQISVGSHAYNGTVEVSSFRDTGHATRPAEIRSNSGLAAPRSVKVFGRAGERLFLLRSVS